MNLKKQIQIIALKVLHANLNPQNNQWSQISLFANTYGDDAVLQAFENWANEQEGERLVTYPLSEFIKAAPRMFVNLVREDKTPIDQVALDELCSELYLIGGPAFSGKTRAALAELVQTYSHEEIKSAYAELIAGFDDFQLKMATKTFAEGGGKAVLMAARKRAEQQKQQQALIDRTRRALLETGSLAPPVEDEPAVELPEV